MNLEEIRMWECELDSSGPGQGPVVGSYDHGNESSGFIKSWEFHDQLSDYQLLNEDLALWS
jgi:hypothetical protein